MPLLNMTEGNLCLTLEAHIVLMMVKNINNQDHKVLGVTSGSSNTSRPPVMLFKMVNEQKSQFVSSKLAQFVEQKQIRIRVSAPYFMKCLHLFL